MKNQEPHEINFGSHSLVFQTSDRFCLAIDNPGAAMLTPRLEAEEKNLLHEFWSEQRMQALSSESAAEVVTDFMTYIERRMSELVQRHSPLFWIALSRYDYTYQDKQIRELYGQLSEKDFRNFVVSILAVLEKAALKFGATALDEFEVTALEAPIPLRPTIPVSVEDVLDCRRLLVLAIAFDNAKENLLGLVRGGTPVYTGSVPILRVSMTKETERLQDLYEMRGRAVTPGAWFGARLDISLTEKLPGDGLVIFNFAPSVKPQIPFATHKVDPSQQILRPSFFRTQLDLKGLFAFLSRFPGAFQRATQATPRDFFALWVALHRLAYAEFLADNRKYQAIQWHGLAVLPEHSSLLDLLCPHFSAVTSEIGDPVPESRARKIVSGLLPLLTAQTGPTLELDVLSEVRPLYGGPGRYLLDVTVGLDLFQHLLDAVREFRGSEAFAKGSAFEKQLWTELSGDPRFVIWDPPENELKFPDGVKGEVDLAILRGDCLVLVEAKAQSIRFDYLKGDRKGIRHREKQLRDALTQIEETAGRLVRFPKGLNYELPPGTRFIVTVVCTALPEWVGSTKPEHWLTPKVPRFCTPEELARVLHHNGPKYLANLPYARLLATENQ